MTATLTTRTHDLLPTPAIELGSAVMIALSKLGEKYANRDELQDGASYEIHAHVAGTVNGHAFTCPLDAHMTVGHETTRASSVTPCVTEILALVLGKLNAATRASVVNEVLEMYDATGTVEAGEANIAIVDELLSQMRQAKSQTVRGSVKVEAAKKSPLSIDVAA